MMGRRKKTFGANYCHSQVPMMPIQEAETTHPIYFAAAITRARTYLNPPSPQMSLKHPSPRSIRILLSLHLTSLLLSTHQVQTSILSNCPGLPALFQTSSISILCSISAFLLDYVCTPATSHECFIIPSDINPAKRYLKTIIDADRCCDDRSWQDT